MRIGLTGGIGSGKSTVAGMLADHGFVVLDADAVAREVVEPGEPALAAIVAHFGDGILTADGQLDRGALADIVFSDPTQRVVLEGITHPAIHAEIVRREEAARVDDPAAVVVVDHPLIIETDQVDDFDALIVVLASRDTRVHRLTEHRGMGPDDARARMDHQATDEERRVVATWIVDNDGDRAELQAAVDEVAGQVRAAARRHAGGVAEPGAGDARG